MHWTRHVLSIIACFLGVSGAAADSIDGTWRVVGFSGEGWFVDPRTIIGRSQSFNRGSSEGVFYACDFTGQSATYTVYGNEDFFANPEFELFVSVRASMTLSSERLFVHRITCNGNGDAQLRRVLYPFVTNEARASAWYLYEGGIFSLFRP